MFIKKHTSLGLLASRARLQNGFTLIELILTLSIVSVLGVIATSQIARQSEEYLAEGAGKYIQTVAAAAERHTLLNFNDYAAGNAIPGVAVALQPTLAELVALGRLNAGFPVGPGSMPTQQQLRIDVTRVGCPGAACTLTTTACTTTPVTLGGPAVRMDLAQTMVDVQGGTGGKSFFGAGANIRGPQLNTANPLGNIEGIVCGSTVIDTALFNRFVQIQDLRDPNLQGALTVAGATTFNGPTIINNTANVTGALTAGGDTSVAACARILAATGRAGFGCTNPNDLPVGYTGGVRTPDLVANGRMVATDNPAAYTGFNTNYAFAGIEAGVAEIRTSGRSAGDRLTPLGQYTPGAACVAADEGSIARRLGGTGLVVCQSAVWRPMATGAAPGDACGVEGATATGPTGLGLLCVGGFYRGMDTIIRPGTPGQACAAAGSTAIDTANSNEVLICRANLAGGGMRYMRLRDVTQHLSFVTSLEVQDNQVVTKPTCAPAAAQTAIPVIQLISKIVSTTDGGIAVYAIDNGPDWTVQLRNGSNVPLIGAPAATAVAQLFCYFP